ncbi:hypothetical protein CYMTET_56081 [Cymbomonas tetramitiformis]|uniref:Right handed beta helix domain-containing protein n=1 Tax=Cymbomonas tetramitiformis TaxID=36881 RepID=A0AAE0BDD5_9CHLO|nr:hypothetical protein CYMTET_56081 [Cymbomonas tetramitiformis]
MSSQGAGCDEVVSCEGISKTECAQEVNAALTTSNRVVCLESGQTYTLSCDDSRENYNGEAYLLHINNVYNVTLKSTGDKAAVLQVEYADSSCGTFSLERSKVVTLEGLEIDANRSTSSLVRFLNSSTSWMTLEVAEDSSYNSYSFHGFDNDRAWLSRIESMKPVERRPGEGEGRWRYVIDSNYYTWKGKKACTVTSWDEDTRVLNITNADYDFAEFQENIEYGRLFVIRNEDYGANGVHVFRSENVTLRRLDFFTAPGMTYWAHLTHNLEIDQCSLQKRGDRPFSGASDGAMLISLTGHVALTNSLIEGHQDDSVNVRHSVEYITYIHPTNRSNLTFDMHFAPVLPYSTGQVIRFFNKTTFEIQHETTVTTAECGETADRVQEREQCAGSDGQFHQCCYWGWGETRLFLADPLPASVTTDSIAFIPEFTPDHILIHNNTLREARGKGVVLTTGKGTAAITDNIVDSTTKSAVLVANGPVGETYDQGPFAQDVVVAGNTITVEYEVSEESAAYNTLGYIVERPNVEGAYTVEAPIQFAAIFPGEEDSMLFRGSPQYGKVSVYNNSLTLGGVVMDCRRSQYCRKDYFQPYEISPRRAIVVQSAQDVTVEGNWVKDYRRTLGGTRMVPDGDCTLDCADTAPTWMTDNGLSCSEADEQYGAGWLLSKCNSNSNWRSNKYCAQGFGHVLSSADCSDCAQCAGLQLGSGSSSSNMYFKVDSSLDSNGMAGDEASEEAGGSDTSIHRVTVNITVDGEDHHHHDDDDDGHSALLYGVMGLLIAVLAVLCVGGWAVMHRWIHGMPVISRRHIRDKVATIHIHMREAIA